jgi:hypothetical protein
VIALVVVAIAEALVGVVLLSGGGGRQDDRAAFASNADGPHSPSKAASASAAGGPTPGAETDARAAAGTPVMPPDPGDVTPSVALDEPYENPLHAQIDFGRHSYYLTPWRAYMDTWPASRFLECLGVAANIDAAEADAVAAVCAEAGIHSARVEIGWGNMSYDDPAKLSPHAAESASRVLRAFGSRGIRPIILLNAHHGIPVPLRWFDVNLTEPVAQGSREIVVDRIDEIRPGYTGLTNATEYLAAFPMIVSVDAAAKRCTLSAPMPKALPAGTIHLSLLRYQPFAGSVFADGSPNEACAETIDGWLAYVGAICRLATEAIGTRGSDDAGFDLEVWNEYTFGSNFLDINRHYDPPLQFKMPLVYEKHGRTAEGCEAILPMTVDYAAENYRGVNVISGFANQRPWDSGSGMWPHQAGISRHYYTGITLEDISPQNPRSKTSGPLNALGHPDGTPDGKDWHTVRPGTFFVPTLNVSMPEFWHYGYQTELMTRDVQPFPSTSGGPISFAGHHRYAHPGTGRAGQVWMTEFNLDRSRFAESVCKAAGCAGDDPRLISLLHRLGAKATLRTFVMQSHKGVHTITLFCIKGAGRAWCSKATARGSIRIALTRTILRASRISWRTTDTPLATTSSPATSHGCGTNRSIRWTRRATTCRSRSSTSRCPTSVDAEWPSLRGTRSPTGRCPSGCSLQRPRPLPFG